MALLGLGIGWTSSRYALGWDEGAWLAVARRMALGDVLYRDVIENKAPAVLGLVGLLDIVPGPYESTRAVVLGLLAFALAYLSNRIAAELGAHRTRALAVAVLVAVLAALQAEFLLTTELLAVTLILAAMLQVIRKRTAAAGLLLTVAALIDLRAPVVLPAVALLARQLGGRQELGRLARWVTPIAAFWIVVLATPDLRFALVELNFASRSGAALDVSYLANVLRSAVPVVLALLVVSELRHFKDRSPLTVVTLALIVVGGLIPLISLKPFDHYWTFALLPLPVAAALAPGSGTARRPAATAVLAVALAISLIPVVEMRYRSVEGRRLEVAHYQGVASVLEDVLADDETFVQFDPMPFLPALLPEHFGARSPVLGYLSSDSVRTEREISLLSQATSAAAAILDDGVLDAERFTVGETFLPLWDMFQSHLAEFPCRSDIGRTTLRVRAELCLRLPDG